MLVKIYGAGSIGNHLANASKALGWDVDVYDIDPKALERMQYEIYPTRYGNWDKSIGLYENKELRKKEYDYIFIGTPPDTHAELLLNSLKENPKGILVEKPLCRPEKSEIEKLSNIENSKIPIFVGYDHVVSQSINKLKQLIVDGKIGKVLTIDVDFRENWSGIFDAHPWLDGPSDTYLGYWEKGGGASGEHSHALNLWQYLSIISNAGKVKKIDSMIDYVRDNKIFYDKLCMMHLETESGLKGRVVQDVITNPSKKTAIVQGDKGRLEWICHFEKNNDRVILYNKDKNSEVFNFYKKRPDDFICELKHIDSCIKNSKDSPIEFSFGLNTMKLLNIIHQQHQS